MGKRKTGDTRRGLLKEKEAAIQRSYYKYIAGNDSDSSSKDVSSIRRSAFTSKNKRARVSDDKVDGANDDMQTRTRKGKRKIDLSTEWESEDQSTGSESDSDNDTSDDNSDDVPTGVCYYRFNIQAAIKELGPLKYEDSHMSIMRRTPFFPMFLALRRSDFKKRMRMCKKHEGDIRKVIKTFDSGREGFFIGGEFVKINRSDVQLILGVCDGELLTEENEVTSKPSWVQQCFPNHADPAFSMPKKTIYEKLKKKLGKKDVASIEDSVRLTCCYLLAAVLTPNQNTHMAWQLAFF